MFARDGARGGGAWIRIWWFRDNRDKLRVWWFRPLATKLRSGDACCELAISENLKIGELKRRLYSALSANGQLSLATSASALRLFKRSGARTGGLLRDAKTVRSEGL